VSIGSSFRRAALVWASLAVAVYGVSHAQVAKNSLIFYADKRVSNDLWAPLFTAVQEDLAAEDFGVASPLLDRQPRLLRGNEIFPGEEFHQVVQVKLLGRCDVAQQAYRPLKPGPLGWVLRVQGQIQPYIYVDCTRMAQVLNPTTLGMSNTERTRAMTQAIAHVLVHEWIHIATQNAGHSSNGISQAQLTAHTLISEPEQSHLSTQTSPVKTGIASESASSAAEN
jgi:hypothetical protein